MVGTDSQTWVGHSLLGDVRVDAELFFSGSGKNSRMVFVSM